MAWSSENEACCQLVWLYQGKKGITEMDCLQPRVKTEDTREHVWCVTIGFFLCF